LAKELGGDRTILYHWKNQSEPGDESDRVGYSPVRELRREVRDLKRVLAEKMLEWIFSEVPCKKSRLDAGAATVLARRHLRAGPRSDADARQPEYRAHVPVGAGKPCELLSVTERAGAARS
jgi:hypothetical protein